jgi:hypothetical protein
MDSTRSDVRNGFAGHLSKGVTLVGTFNERFDTEPARPTAESDPLEEIKVFELALLIWFHT